MSRQKEQLKDLAPRAYAPYANPRDYILSWTDEIWVTKALGRLGDHYSQDIKVHTAYGETYGFADVIGTSALRDGVALGVASPPICTATLQPYSDARLWPSPGLGVHARQLSVSVR